MTKADLVEAIAEQADLKKADAERALAAFVDTVAKALSRGQSLQITGFGTFEPRKRAARKARNPQTGEEIDVPATTVPAFRAGKSLKDVVK
ncbi:MAG: HU family DNA-binding protein [candidate division WS1 bacterium]|nr:HU family DNA-binding protein [candidate division WS1 bacterium]